MIEAEPKTPDGGAPVTFQQMIKRFYFYNLTACHVAIGALLGALLSCTLVTSTDAVLSTAAGGAFYGWIIGTTRSGLFAVAGAVIGATISLLAGAHGAVAMAVVSNGAIWGWLFSMSGGSSSE